jgi:ADP-ribose pyrophosphatase
MTKVSTNWKTLAQKLLVDNRFVYLWEDRVLTPYGKEADYYVLRKKPFSIIIPIQDGEVYLVRQFRYHSGQITLEFCMGYAEGKGPEETAKTELREEMGATAGKLIELGHMYIAPGITDQIAYVYLATELVFADQELEDGEFIEIEKYPLEKIPEMIKSGEIDGAGVIASYYMFEEYVKTHSL